MPMKQQTLAMAADQSGYEHYRKPTRRDEFLASMEVIVPWSTLCEVIEPHYPKAGNGRPPIGLERMLRIHFLQHWFNLADLACEEALYDSASLRRFVGIDLGREPVPDATTLLKFRRLLNSMPTSSARPCLPRWGKSCRREASRSTPAPSWTPPPSARPARRRMQTRRETPRCTRPARANNGISA